MATFDPSTDDPNSYYNEIMQRARARSARMEETLANMIAKRQQAAKIEAEQLAAERREREAGLKKSADEQYAADTNWLSSAGQGASQGFSSGGPWGAIIGGAIGTIMGVAKSASAHRQKSKETGGKAGKFSARDLFPVLGYGKAGAGRNVAETLGSMSGVGGGIAGKALEKKYPTTTTGYKAPSSAPAGSDLYGAEDYKQEHGYYPQTTADLEGWRQWKTSSGNTK